MGIRDYLKDWVDPNPEKWKIGDKAITNFDMEYSFGKVPAGSVVVIDSLPEARHGAGPGAGGSVTWKEHKGLQRVCASSYWTRNTMHQTNDSRY